MAASTQEAAKQLADSIVNATAVMHNPGSSQEQRAEAVRFFEQVCAVFDSRRVPPCT